jgi:hypothetical protein
MKSKSQMWLEFLNIILATTAVSMAIFIVAIYTEIK